MELRLKRTVLNISTICNLKCKHCLAFIPYYKEASVMDIETATRIIDNYWKIVDSAEHFTVTGGEPLMNPNATEIMRKVYKYKEFVSGSIDFVTNGTILIPNDLLNLFAENREKTKIILSDYGNNLSKHIGEIEQQLIDNGIPYRISKFHGDTLYYEGWIDFSDHTLKWKTEEERNDNASKCIHNIGKYFIINDGELHRCSRSYWRIKNGIIPKIPGEYVPLIDETISVEKKRQMLIKLLSMTSSTSCAYCIGFRNDVPRVKPAQQL